MFNFGMYGSGPGAFPFGMGAFFLVVALWAIVWKGLALWHSARRGEQWWFLALLVLNTAGILELVYLFGFAKMKFDELFPGMQEATKPSTATKPATDAGKHEEHKTETPKSEG